MLEVAVQCCESQTRAESADGVGRKPTSQPMSLDVGVATIYREARYMGSVDVKQNLNVWLG